MRDLFSKLIDVLKDIAESLETIAENTTPAPDPEDPDET